MYESPLNKIYSNIQSQMLKQDEENMMLCVNQAVGYSVDKEELIKALSYDRDQYKKGYADAMAVIEDIKSEITTYKDDKIIHFESNCMIDIVLDIIDNHMRGET